MIILKRREEYNMKITTLPQEKRAYEVPEIISFSDEQLLEELGPARAFESSFHDCLSGEAWAGDQLGCVPDFMVENF
jgi:hypothetical protein